MDYCMRRAAFLKVKLYVLWLRLYTSALYKNKVERKSNFKKLRYAAEKKYLSRYLYVVKSTENTPASTAFPKIIWTCWWQGEQNLPPVIKKCIASIRKHCPDFELRVISADNMHDYIELPDYILQKHKKGYISRTHLSDILRISLLEKYGGLWMDATVLLTAGLPQIMLDSPFFAYHCHELYQGQIWFFKTYPHHPIISGLKKLLLAYWKDENKIINYFFAYILWDLLLENNTECNKLWAQTTLIYDDCYELADNFFEPYSLSKWATIKAKTTIHKLSWKYKKEPPKDSFLACLLNGKLEN